MWLFFNVQMIILEHQLEIDDNVSPSERANFKQNRNKFY